MSTAPLHLVTGGTGFLGSALVRRLAGAGHPVRVLDNNWRGLPSRLRDIDDRIELIDADIRDAEVVHRAVDGAETVWHLAGVNGTGHFYTHPDLVLDVGVRGTLNLLDALKNGARNLFFASSSEVYQSPVTIPTDETASLVIPDVLNPRYSYAGAKLIGELMALHQSNSQSRRIVIFRPHNVYGPDMGGQHVIPEFALRMMQLCGSPRGAVDFPIEGTGRETRAFTYIDDFIDGLMLLLECAESRSIYNVGTDEETEIATLAREIASCFGREIRIIPGSLRAGSAPRRCPDISRLRKLGFAPRVSLHDGLQTTVRWYRDNIDGYRSARRVA